MCSSFWTLRDSIGRVPLRPEKQGVNRGGEWDFASGNDFGRVRDPGDHVKIRNRTEPVITQIYTVITACLMPDAGLISQLAMPLNSVLIGVNRSVQSLFYSEV